MGDLVILNEDEYFVGEQIHKFLEGRMNEEIVRSIGPISMLGNTYPIVPTKSKVFDENWVGLQSDDGKQWYFPKTTLRKVEGSKWTYIVITRNQDLRPFLLNCEVAQTFYFFILRSKLFLTLTRFTFLRPLHP